MNKKQAHIVPHTHWDREWRYPIWKNRSLLVDFMDELLRVLAENPDYKQFIMDGQSVVMEDYLEIRPEKRTEVEKYVAEGRITCGPWYTLPDLYPIDGECLIRNLLKGFRVSEKFGKTMKIAYTSFGWGQTAQFPQIYAGFGIDFSITAKKVSEERAPKSEFWWESPDGTKVLTSRLGRNGRAQFFITTVIPAKYNVENDKDYHIEWKNAGMVYHKANANAADVDYFRFNKDNQFFPETISENIKKCIVGTSDTLVDDVRFLPAGCDFSGCIEDLDQIIDVANEKLPDWKFKHSTLEDYIKNMRENLDESKLSTVYGELRDGPSAACSGNALSTRLYIKQANKKAQNILLYHAEPLSSAMGMLGEDYEEGFLSKAWEYMLKAHPHDSINGVTQDKTAQDNMFRIAQATEIADVVSERAMSKLISHMDLSKYTNDDVLMISYNPLPFPVSEVLQICVDMPSEQNAWDFIITDENGEKMDVQWISKDSHIAIIHDPNSRPWPFHLDRHTVYMNSGIIPAGGFKVYKAETDRTFERSFICGTNYQRTTFGNEIAKGDHEIENEYLKVEIQNNGTFTLTDKENNKVYENLHYFEETGEVGDYWINFPPNYNKTFVSTALPAKIWVENNGALSATIGLQTKMELPKSGSRPASFFGSGTKRNEETELLVITTYLTLKKGSRCVEVRVETDNNIEDHRLRVMYPTGLSADYSYAAGHFGVDKRPCMPTADQNVEYWQDMQTLPQQTFVDVTNGTCGLAFVNNSLTEYELKNDGKATLALTLLRGVKNIICTECRAINEFPNQKGGQCLGKQIATYAIYPHKGNWQDGKVYIEAQKFNANVIVMQTSAHKNGNIPARSSLYAMSNDNLVMTAFKKCEGRNSFIFRFFNPIEQAQETELSFYANVKKAYLTNLNEERQSEIPVQNGHSLHLIAGKAKIITVEIQCD